MTVVDNGHSYLLDTLDSTKAFHLVFVKRQGLNYPGNNSHYGGTTLQEVWRATLDRLIYLNKQKWSPFNYVAMGCILISILCLEWRAAIIHGRKLPFNVLYGETCYKCLHIGCKGDCK